MKFHNVIESLRQEVQKIKKTCSNVKSDIIQGLWGKNVSSKNRINTLKVQFEGSDTIPKKMDKYSRRNNVAVYGIPYSMKQRELNDKCTECFGKKNIKIGEIDIKSCHGLVKSSKTIIHFANRTLRSKYLAKNLIDLKKDRKTK